MDALLRRSNDFVRSYSSPAKLRHHQQSGDWWLFFLQCWRCLRDLLSRLSWSFPEICWRGWVRVDIQVGPHCCSEPVSYAAIEEDGTSGLVIEVFDDLDKVCTDVVLLHGCPQSCMPNLVEAFLYYHKVMCHAEKLVHHLQCQGHSEGLKSKYDCFYYLLNCWSICNQTWFLWYSIISQSVLWENGITAFKVMVTVKGKNISECLSGWYLLNHRTFCRQTWYGYAAS